MDYAYKKLGCRANKFFIHLISLHAGNPRLQFKGRNGNSSLENPIDYTGRKRPSLRLLNMMYVILGNYGDDTIALIQWVYEQQLSNVHVISIDTGWAAEKWIERYIQGDAYTARCGYVPTRLVANMSFAELAQEQGQFPSQQFSWCIKFLKALPFLEWLDKKDPECMATIILAKRRVASRANQHLHAMIEESEYYDGRKLWYPLLDYTDKQRDALLSCAGFVKLGHRSLECDPCIYNTLQDFQRTSAMTVKKVEFLENRLKTPMFNPAAYQGAKTIAEVVALAKQTKVTSEQKQQENFAMGCEAPFGCGL